MPNKFQEIFDPENPPGSVWDSFVESEIEKIKNTGVLPDYIHISPDEKSQEDLLNQRVRPKWVNGEGIHDFDQCEKAVILANNIRPINFKPFTILGEIDPSLFGPCNADPVVVEVPVKLHPAMVKIRNKRKRLRIFKLYKRQGITHYISPGWRVSPLDSSSETKPPFQRGLLTAKELIQNELPRN